MQRKPLNAGETDSPAKTYTIIPWQKTAQNKLSGAAA